MKTAKKKNKLNLILPIIIAIIIVLGLWFWNYLTLFHVDDTERGTFGDMFGSVNAIFSGLAFAGIIITIYIQSHELKLQRKELKLTRKEAKLTRSEFITQNETMRLQQFENTYFQLLNMFNTNIDKLKYRDFDRKSNGRDVLYSFISSINSKIEFNVKEQLKIEPYDLTNYDKEIEIGIFNLSKYEIINIYTEVKEWYKSSLQTYFLNLYTILRFIEQAEINDKKLYLSIIKSQLDTNEILILFYESLSEGYESDFTNLIRYFNLVVPLKSEMINNNELRSELLKFNK